MRVAFLLFFAISYVEGNCQIRSVSASELHMAKVTNWSQLVMLVRDNYWDDKIDQISAQIGKEGFENVIKYSSRAYLPCQMQVFCEDIDNSPIKNIDTLSAALERLVVYKYATFFHLLPDGNKKYYTILSVPYEPNKNWSTKAKWDTVYFILPSEYVLEKSSVK